MNGDLVDAIVDALRVLGTGKCDQLNCDGCEYERDEAVAILRAAIIWPLGEEPRPATDEENAASRALLAAERGGEHEV